jgi:hypothetical protein
MRSGSRAALAALAFAASLAGCTSPNVNSPSIRGLAYVRMDDVVKHDPLYAQLQTIDVAIATVQLQGVSPRVPRSAAEIAREDARLRAEIAAAKARTQRIIDSKQQEYRARAQAAISAALGAAGNRSGANVASALGGATAQQAQAAQMQAGRDMRAYQSSVMQQGSAAAHAIVTQLQREADQKLTAKAMQEQQRETNLTLRLSQQDAAQRLSIQTKLSMLALDPATRRQLQGQLNAMNQRDNAQVNALRAADQREFAAYRRQVMAETNDAMRAQLSQINDQTRAKLVTHENALGTQLRNTLGARQPVMHVSPATQAQIRAIEARIQQQYQADIQNVLSEYATTSDALEVQYAQLHGADADAASASEQEVAILQQRRQALYDQIVAHVQQEAQRLASNQGFHVVFSGVTAAPGGYDMTNDLIHDIESEHE